MTQNRTLFDWETYSQFYDFISDINPEYQKLKTFCQQCLKSLDLPPRIKIGDIAGGTGNFSVACAELFPYAQIDLYDNSPAMLKEAQRKTNEHHISNIIPIMFDITQTQMPQKIYDVIIMIHALFIMPEHKEYIVRNIYNSLKAKGYFFIIDMGRKNDINAWRHRLFKSEDQVDKYGHDQLKEMQEYCEGYIREFTQLVTEQQRQKKLYLHTLSGFESFIRGHKSQGYCFKILGSGDDLYNPFIDGASCGLDDWVLAQKEELSS